MKHLEEALQVKVRIIKNITITEEITSLVTLES